MVENMILSMAQRGQLPGKLGESELINILESVNKQISKKTTVNVSNTTEFFYLFIYFLTFHV